MYNKVKNIHKHFLESPTSVNTTAHDTILNGGTHESLHSLTLQEKGWSHFFQGTEFVNINHCKIKFLAKS